MAAKKKNKTAPRRPPPKRSGPQRVGNVRAKGAASSAKTPRAGVKKASKSHTKPAKPKPKPKPAAKPKARPSAPAKTKSAAKAKAAPKQKVRPAAAPPKKSQAKAAAKAPPAKKGGLRAVATKAQPRPDAQRPPLVAKASASQKPLSPQPPARPPSPPTAGTPQKGASSTAPRTGAPARSASAPDKPLGKGRGKASKLQSSRAGKPLADSPAIAVRKTTSEPPRRPSERPLRESNRPPAIVSLPIPVLPVVRRPTVEERAQSIEQRLAAQSEDFRQRYLESFDMSWIYHDSALEGVVYTYAELRAALGDEPLPVTDSSLQPTVEDIRRHKEAIDFVRDFATKKQKAPITVDVVKKIYLILHPSEGDIKTVKYRKDIPQHRLYFHEYAAPDKIAYKVRQVVDWINDPETRKTRNGLRLAARAHYDMLRVFPFPVDSGKVCRLFMNLLLMRTGLPPAIIHSTERQRYYDALKGSASTVLSMVQEAVENALSSVEKLLDEHETKTRAFVS